MIRKFPHYTQLDTMDCGPSCLRMIAKHYGRSYSLQNVSYAQPSRALQLKYEQKIRK